MQYMKKLIKGNELLSVKSRAVVLQLTKPSIYTVKGKVPFGIGLKRHAYRKTFFVVNTVYQDGSIKQWNGEFPDRQVSAGDIIREVNGVKGSETEVATMLAKGQNEEKDLLIFHYPDP